MCARSRCLCHRRGLRAIGSASPNARLPHNGGNCPTRVVCKRRHRWCCGNLLAGSPCPVCSCCARGCTRRNQSTMFAGQASESKGDSKVADGEAVPGQPSPTGAPKYRRQERLIDIRPRKVRLVLVMAGRRARSSRADRSMLPRVVAVLSAPVPMFAMTRGGLWCSAQPPPALTCARS